MALTENQKFNIINQYNSLDQTKRTLFANNLGSLNEYLNMAELGKVSGNLLEDINTDYYTSPTEITTLETPDTYTQELGGILQASENLNKKTFAQNRQYLKDAFNRYKSAIDEDVKTFKPYEQRTFQQALTRAQEGFSGRGLLGSGLAKEQQGAFEANRSSQRANTLTSFEKQISDANFGLEKSLASLDIQEEQNKNQAKLNKLYFTNPYDKAGAEAIKSYPTL